MGSDVKTTFLGRFQLAMDMPRIFLETKIIANMPS